MRDPNEVTEETPASVPAAAPAPAPVADPVAPEAEAAPADGAAPAEPAPAVVTDYASQRAFSEFPLSPEVLQGIAEKGYTMATRVQASTLEAALAGRDLVVRSKTGTGKTAAFCIPTLERIAAGARAPRAIVLAPTRELARQVAEEAGVLGKYKDLRVACIYGGVGFGPQEDALRDGVEFVVGTPGRILDHMRRGNLDLRGIEVAILDEADEMLGMGFFEDVTKILDQTPKSRQCLFFSATVDEKVRSLIRRYAKDPEDLRLSTDADKVDGITHVLYETSTDFHKARALLALIDQEEPKSAIIFCNTREDTATVATYLARQGLDAELLSGELPQNKREQVMARVKRGETQFLVATDVAARGIDISDLSHVINYALPEDAAVYMHRTGRTGRIGKTGVAISLVGGSEHNQRKVLERQYGIAFDQRPLPSPEEASRLRVERQAKAIREACKTMAFEGYLGTVRALKERPDGDMLLAAALRGFFLWDRTRRAAEGDAPDSVGALQEARAEKAEGRSGRDGDRPRRDRDGDRPRRDGERRDRDGDRRERDGDRPRRDGERRDRDGERPRRERDGDRPRRERPAEATEGEPGVAPPAPAPAPTDDPPPAARRAGPADDDDADDLDLEDTSDDPTNPGAATDATDAAKKKRRRRRRRSGRGRAEGSAAEGGSAPASGGDGPSEG